MISQLTHFPPELGFKKSRPLRCQVFPWIKPSRSSQRRGFSTMATYGYPRWVDIPITAFMHVFVIAFHCLSIGDLNLQISVCYVLKKQLMWFLYGTLKFHWSCSLLDCFDFSIYISIYYLWGHPSYSQLLVVTQPRLKSHCHTIIPCLQTNCPWLIPQSEHFTSFFKTHVNS